MHTLGYRPPTHTPVSCGGQEVVIYIQRVFVVSSAPAPCPATSLHRLPRSLLTCLPLLPTEFEEGLLDRCPAPGPHPALVEGRRSSVKVEAEASRQ